jgi:hypothetical protein
VPAEGLLYRNFTNKKESDGVMGYWAIKGGKDFVSLNPAFKCPIILLF